MNNIQMHDHASTATLFVSYSRREVALAGLFSRTLAAAGTPCWVDLEQIRPSDEWSLTVDAALRKSSALVLLASRGSVVSPHCRSEVSTAIASGKTVIIAVVDRVSLPPESASYPIVDLRRAADMTRWDELIRSALLVQIPQSQDSVREASRMWVPRQLAGLFGLLVLVWLFMLLGLWSALGDAAVLNSTGYRTGDRDVGEWLLRLQVVGAIVLLALVAWWSSRVLVRKITGRQVIAVIAIPLALFTFLENWALIVVMTAAVLVGMWAATSEDLAGPWLPGGTWRPPRPQGAQPLPPPVRRSVYFTVVNVPADRGFARTLTRRLCARGHHRDDSAAGSVRLVILSNAADCAFAQLAGGGGSKRTIFLILYAIRRDVLDSLGLSEYHLIDMRRGGPEQLNALAVDMVTLPVR